MIRAEGSYVAIFSDRYVYMLSKWQDVSRITAVHAGLNLLDITPEARRGDLLPAVLLG